MKTIDLAKGPLTVEELLATARDESIIVQSTDGSSFVVSAADDLTTEIELLRRNHRFLGLLDSLKEDQRTVSLEEVEEQLR